MQINFFLIEKYYSLRDCVRNTKTRRSNNLTYSSVLTYLIVCTYLFPQVLHKDLKAFSTWQILGQIEHL